MFHPKSSLTSEINCHKHTNYNMKMIRTHFSLITFFLFLFITVLAFGSLAWSFFLQDEWLIFGNYLYWQKMGLSWIERLFFYGGFTHLIPFANIFSYLQFIFFGLNFAPYAITSVFLHVVNALLVTKIALESRYGKAIGFLSGLFFLINPTTGQAVTWIATAPGTVVSVTFTLFTLLFFLRKNMILSFACLILALGFKESSVFLFLYLPVLWILTLQNDKRSFRSSIGVLILLGTLYIGVRLLFRFAGPQVPAIQSFSQPSFFVYLYRVVSHPFKAFSQSIFPQEIIINISNEMMKLAYPTLVSGKVPDPYIAQSVGSDIVSYSLSILIIGVIFVVGKLRTLGLPLLFVAMSVLPLIFIPGSAGYISLFDGRHLYMTSIGISIVLAMLFVSMSRTFLKLRWFIVGIVGIYFGYSVWYIHSAIARQVSIADTRKIILEKIITWYPKLPERALIITQSDKAFYGLPPEEYILPFQSGFGNTLLVWYDRHGDSFPACFFEHKFLYELTSQDYKECGGRGFGYFRSPDNISVLLKKYNLSKDNVLSFSYTYQDNVISDTTKKLQSRLTQ